MYWNEKKVGMASVIDKNTRMLEPTSILRLLTMILFLLHPMLRKLYL
jgi:hypothetical protein